MNTNCLTALQNQNMDLKITQSKSMNTTVKKKRDYVVTGSHGKPCGIDLQKGLDAWLSQHGIGSPSCVLLGSCRIYICMIKEVWCRWSPHRPRWYEQHHGSTSPATCLGPISTGSHPYKYEYLLGTSLSDLMRLDLLETLVKSTLS